MTSRKAKRREREYHTESVTTVNGEVIAHERPQWPKFYELWEHTHFQTVLIAPSPGALLDIENMMQKGNALCTHKDQLGECIHIEKTTIKQWLAAHPGGP